MAFGIGFILGPALGGWLGEIDPRSRFGARRRSAWRTPAGFFVLPESLTHDKRMAFSWKRAIGRFAGAVALAP
jgi:DHA1 family tetracycline resistance protein-like MFS transporter